MLFLIYFIRFNHSNYQIIEDSTDGASCCGWPAAGSGW
jgi:hypothetical protein